MKKISILLTGLAFSVGFGQLTSYEGTSSNIVIDNSNTEPLLATCNEGVANIGGTNFIGDFSPISLANEFVVDANTTFTLSELEMWVTIKADATITNAMINIYSDDNGTPGEPILSESITVVPTSFELVRDVNFTGEDPAGEYLVKFDISNLGSLTAGAEDTRFWIGTQTTPSVTPLRYTYEPTSDEFSSFILVSDAWRTLATQTDPDTTLEVPFTVYGDCTTMGISDVNASLLAVYPNPAKDVLNVSLKNAEVKSISVTNLSGQTVATSKNSTVNVAALPAGVYVVKVIDTKGAVHTSKVVVK